MMNEYERTWNTLFAPGDVVEVRAIMKKAGKSRHWEGWSSGIVVGYFDNPEDLTLWVEPLDNSGRAEGIYVTLNPINPALLARAANRLIGIQKKGVAVGDGDILLRRWMLIDIDPIRPKGISSSDMEMRRTYQTTTAIVEWLDDNGFPEPVQAMSGNGYHLLYPLANLENINLTSMIIQEFLHILHRDFDDYYAHIDTSIFNPSRMVKLYGTWVRKGDETEDRPHRRSKILL